MTREELIEWRKSTGKSQEQFVRDVIKVRSLRAYQNWEYGLFPVPELVDDKKKLYDMEKHNT